jgi:eukaryotic-like serine/threonine-protein kinase
MAVDKQQNRQTSSAATLPVPLTFQWNVSHNLAIGLFIRITFSLLGLSARGEMSEKLPKLKEPELTPSAPSLSPDETQPNSLANKPTENDLPGFAPPSAAGEVGRLGKYRIQKELGRGGMGAVYLAFDERLQRKVALKVMLPKAATNEQAKERFLREARAAAQISSDYVVTIHEADEIDGVPYIALQYLQGYPLDEYLKKKGLPSISQVLRIGRETALGLAAAHSLGLVHRDIKPGNIWLESPNGRVKILDFGLAKPVVGSEGAELTGAGTIMGTPAYMAPEQGMGRALDGRADLFSLGCMLYRLTTGKLPFDHPTLMAILTAIATEEPTPVRELNPEIPKGLANLIHRLLAKKPAQRPENATVVAQELDSLIQQNGPDGASKPLPNVVYAPMAVSMQVSNPFEDIDIDTEAVAPQPKPREEREKPKAKSRLLWLWVAIGFFGLLCCGAAGVIIIKITNKDGSVTKIEVPEGSKVEVIKPKGKETAPASNLSTDRKAAEWVLSIGGTVRIDGSEKEIREPSELPRNAIRLVAVDLHSKKQVIDQELTRFKDCKNLQEIILAGTEVGDAGMAHFKECKKLKKIHIAHTQVTDSGINNFKDCEDLEIVDFSGTKISDIGLAYFKDCKNLKQFYLGNCNVTDAGLAIFKGRGDITTLGLGGTKITDTGLSYFKECKNLSTLTVDSTQATDAGLNYFSNCKNLWLITIQKTKVTAAKFEQLKKALPKCKIISDFGTYEPVVAHRKVAEKVLALGGESAVRVRMRDSQMEQSLRIKDALPKEPFELVGVWLATPEATDDLLAELARLKTLHSLRIDNSAVTEKGLVHLQGNLLSIFQGNGANAIGDDGIKTLSTHKGLTWLLLDGSEVTDAGLKSVLEFPELTYLVLSSSKITNAGLVHLKEMKKLQTFFLQGTDISDAGLSHLLACKGLTSLDIRKTTITADGFEKLKKGLPKCRIDSDHGTYEPKKE